MIKKLKYSLLIVCLLNIFCSKAQQTSIDGSLGIITSIIPFLRTYSEIPLCYKLSAGYKFKEKQYSLNSSFIYYKRLGSNFIITPFLKTTLSNKDRFFFSIGLFGSFRPNNNYDDRNNKYNKFYWGINYNSPRN